ncbi:MAG: hypothetical protein GOV15_00160, partial [Candidatus Diapherotrites archaeon]|nr:hypothetical protein [Candidatus Diapherotrites archaeon]
VFMAPAMVKSMPVSAAESQRFTSLVEIPKIMGYLIMSMKLTPNLERAVQFAAEHGEGKLATAFRNLLWNVNVGVYSTLEEGLDDLAYTWGTFSPEFKQSMMTLRSSVLEPDETKRYILYDNALNDVLLGIGNKMSDYARQLKSPAMYMFYLGVLLPLILIIVLPVGSVFSDMPFGNAYTLSAVYNFGIPLMLYVYATVILGKRPPTYIPPKIDDDYPGLPKKGNFFVSGQKQMSIKALALMIIVFGLALTWLAHTILDPTLENVLRDHFGGVSVQNFQADHTEAEQTELLETFDLSPFFLIAGSIFTASLAVASVFYFTAVYKRKVQKEIMAMEVEFKDSTYLLASRLGQNKPIEDAIKYVGEFTPDSKLSSEVLNKIRQNINLLGLTLEDAVFDPTYGVLKNLPSTLLQTSFRIIVDAVKLGVNVAARSVMSLSAQLTAFDKINREIEVELSEITATMTSMATFIAPLVLGITTALQRVVIGTLQSFAGSSSAESQMPQGVSGFGGMTGGGMSEMFSSDALNSAAGPAEFTTILALYVFELVIVMIWFGARIKEGDNNLNAMISIAKSLPIAILLFLLAALFAKGMA